MYMFNICIYVRTVYLYIYPVPAGTYYGPPGARFEQKYPCSKGASCI